MNKSDRISIALPREWAAHQDLALGKLIALIEVAHAATRCLTGNLLDDADQERKLHVLEDVLDELRKTYWSSQLSDLRTELATASQPADVADMVGAR